MAWVLDFKRQTILAPQLHVLTSKDFTDIGMWDGESCITISENLTIWTVFDHRHWYSANSAIIMSASTVFERLIVVFLFQETCLVLHLLYFICWYPFLFNLEITNVFHVANVSFSESYYGNQIGYLIDFTTYN